MTTSRRLSRTKAKIMLVVAAVSLNAALQLTLMPTKISGLMLPGQGERVAMDARTHAALQEAGGVGSMVGQLVLLEGGMGISAVVPMLKVTKLDERNAHFVCVGRGKLKPPLRATRQAFSSAAVEPVVDRRIESGAHEMTDLRARYASCNRLALNLRDGAAGEVSGASERIWRLFEEPLINQFMTNLELIAEHGLW